MSNPLELCKGLTRTVYNKVVEIRGKEVVETRGLSHPLYKFEKDAENAGREFLLKESRRHRGLRIGLGFELYPKWYAIKDGSATEMDLISLKDFRPDILLQTDAIEGSKAEVPVYESSFGKPIQEGGTYEVFTTAIAFYLDKPMLRDAVAAAVQRWDGKQYIANLYEAQVCDRGEPAVLKAEPLKEIALNTKIYTSGHYFHATPIAAFVIETLLEELNIPEENSPGVRSTGSTAYDIVQTMMTSSIAFDIRNEVKKELEKYGIKMKRGSYTHDVAPPGLLAIKAGDSVLGFDRNQLNLNLLEDETTSYFVAPPGEAGETVFRIIKDKVLPQIPERVEHWKRFWEKTS